MSDRCDICRGSKTINLPVHRELEAVGHDPVAALLGKQLDVSHRSFPCPQCAGIADTASVVLVHAQDHPYRAELYDQTDFKLHLMVRHGHMLVKTLISGGYITTREIERRNNSHRGEEVLVRSSLGVVAPAVVASIEQRAVDAGAVIAMEAAQAAVDQIVNWGSYFGTGTIPKVQAEHLIRGAVSAMINKHRDRVRADGKPVRT